MSIISQHLASTINRSFRLVGFRHEETGREWFAVYRRNEIISSHRHLPVAIGAMESYYLNDY